MNTITRPDPSNAAQIAQAKADFEKKYGINKSTRTPQQWKALVEAYGKTQVCQTDGLTPKQLRAKMKVGTSNN